MVMWGSTEGREQNGFRGQGGLGSYHASSVLQGDIGHVTFLL